MTKTAHHVADIDRLIRLPEVLKRTGKSRTSWLDDVRLGKAPAPVKIGARAVAYSEQAINQWIADRLAQRC